MRTPCIRCAAGADVFMTVDYAGQEVWLDDLIDPPAPNTGYPLCRTHAGRFTPPARWTLTDRRSLVRAQLADRVVA